MAASWTAALPGTGDGTGEDRLSKAHLQQLDGLRGPLAMGVIAINMGLYNAGANTPVGTFLVLSGLTSFLAYCGKEWDDVSRAQFFQRRLVRLMPMVLVTTALQLSVAALWLLRPGVTIPELSSGGSFTFVVTSLALVLMLAGSGAICPGTACGCCRIDRWPRPLCSLFLLVLGTYLANVAWYIGLLLLLNAYFLPMLLAAYGEAWRAAPPSWAVLVGWAALEGLQFGVPLAVYAATQDAHRWYDATVLLYLGIPPSPFRLPTFVLGLQLGRWALFETSREGRGASRAIAEARTLVPVLATALVVVFLHGFLTPEPEMHNPSTGSTPLQWAAIHLIHPFNVLALVCGLVAAPQSLVARLLASPPLTILADLSYAIYLLQTAVISLYVKAFNKKWQSELELLMASADASALDALDYGAVVLLCTALAYPVTRWIEPRVAAWLRARVEGATSRAQRTSGVVQL